MRLIAVMVAGLAVAGATAGCAPSQPLAAETTPTVETGGAGATSAGPAVAGDVPVVKPEKLPPYIDLGFFNITVAYGAVSQNKKFWRRVDETAVDVATHDLLDKNGVRVGIGSMADWAGYKEILDAAAPKAAQGHFLGITATDQEIPVCDGDIAEEHLFFFDRHGLSGRVYDDCRNFLVLGYGPSASEAGGVRVEISPLVKSAHLHYHAVVVGDQPNVDFSDEEQIYDLDLHVDLPEGKFLVVAPSEQSEREMSIGHQFLTVDAKPGRRERVMIFIANPRPVVKAVDTDK